MAQTENVNTPCPQYKKLEELRMVTRDLNEGITRLREPECAMVYLPRNPTEGIENVPGFGIVDPWKNRVNMSRLKNMFKDAVEDCVGRAFSKPARLETDTPHDLVKMMDDVDGRGTNFHVFGMSVAQGSTAEGEDFVLVDYPMNQGADTMTQAEWEKLEMAPFWRRYPAKSVIGWEFEQFGKKQRLKLVRLREKVNIKDSEWGTREVNQVRVLRAGNSLLPEKDLARWATWEIWRPTADDKPEGDWIIIDSGSMRPQVEIPFVDFPFLMSAQFESRPPLLDLAHLTIAHYRKMSDLDNAQHASGFPVMHWAGGPIDPETKRPVPLGVSRLFVSPDPNAHAEFVEPEGKAWASLRTELNAMEAHARELAAEPVLTKASGNMTATGEAIRAARASSRLEAAVLGWQDSFNRLFYYTAQYFGVVSYGADSGWGGVKLNRRFVPLSQNVEGVKTAIEMHSIKRLSDETLHEVAQAAEVTPDGIEFEDEERRIAASKPTMAEQERAAALAVVQANAKTDVSGRAAESKRNNPEKGQMTQNVLNPRSSNPKASKSAR